MQNFTQQHLLIGTLQICICEWGHKNQNPSIVILHGWLDHAGTWDILGQNLAKEGYHCIAIDHRGHGLSSHIPSQEAYHFPDYIADLQSLLCLLDITNFVLIGHSMGGTIASIYTAFCQPQPQTLILIDGLGPEHENEEEAFQRLQTHLQQRRTPHQHRPMTLQNAFGKYQKAYPYLPMERIENLASRILHPLYPHNPSTQDQWIWTWDPRHRHRSAIAFHLPRHLSILQKIAIPCFLIFGEQGWYMKMPDLPQRIKAIKNSLVILLPSGHNPHLECPNLLTDCLMNLFNPSKDPST